ncbi:glycerol-3-phosphate acyltransferase 1-like [Zingiber officinale]|uniref:glycerol-3-phosphate acyltransferase 1-like n=1 Tax=Zingiber officinale TaxID=94328 RepID=UPI001C4AC103|nr:glycerol-3-phosphate acyltransferase 1-like [Zingiber officinale]
MAAVPMLLLKVSAQVRFTCCRVVRKLESYGFRSCSKLHHVDRHSLSPTVAGGGSSHGGDGQALVCDFEGALLSTSCTFPYFMLVAFEGGGPLRALLLLLLWPLLWALSRVRRESTMRAMAFVTFCGLSAGAVDLVRRAVLSKFYLENLRLQPCEMLAACTGRRVVVTAMPRPMVEGFLREYLGVSEVVAPELQVAEGRRHFTGFLSVFSRQKALEELFRESKADVAVLSPCNSHDHLLATYSKEIYVVNEEGAATALPRDKYTKPLVFHDGRLAFFPTPCATLAFFLWVPIAVPLAISRILIGTVLPYDLALLVAASAGIRFRLGGQLPAARKGVLFACNHRTLLDPVVLSAALRRPVPAVTYGLSRVSEMIAPVRTVRLARDRVRDAATIRRMLEKGELAMCPEGTTCREPYLLRFSPLFAEVADDIVPVAVETRVGTLHGTTASGRKWFDPVSFLMDPAPVYEIHVLTPMLPAGGRSPAEVANAVQRRIAEVLGFECTGLTRREKYLLLAGNEGGDGWR